MAKSFLDRVLRGLAVAAASACVLTACSKPAETTSPGQNAASSAPTGAPTATSESSEPGGGESVASSGQQALLRAGETALAEVTGSTVVTIERDGGDRRWEVQAIGRDGQKSELAISADGRKVQQGPRSRDENPADRARHRTLVQTAELDYRAAVRKIAAAAPGAITELELDSQRGKTVWEADVIERSGTKQVVIIDAVTGQVLSTPAQTRPTSRRPSPSTSHHRPHHTPRRPSPSTSHHPPHH